MKHMHDKVSDNGHDAPAKKKKKFFKCMAGGSRVQGLALKAK
jgi:hypothetical protein